MLLCKECFIHIRHVSGFRMSNLYLNVNHILFGLYLACNNVIFVLGLLSFQEHFAFNMDGVRLTIRHFHIPVVTISMVPMNYCSLQVCTPSYQLVVDNDSHFSTVCSNKLAFHWLTE
jgi:hypothetical protein